MNGASQSEAFVAKWVARRVAKRNGPASCGFAQREAFAILLPMLYRCLAAACAAALLAACVTPVYPARPSAEAGPPIVELEPTKVMLHTSATLQGLGLLFESALPPSMEGNLNESGTRK